MVKSAKGAAARQQPTREHAVAKPTTEQSATGQSAGEPTSGEQSAGTPTVVQQDPEGSDDSDDGGEAEESTDNDVVEVQNGPRRTSRLRRPPDFFVPAAFTMVYDVDADDPAYDDGEDDDELPELDLDMHADPEHRAGWKKSQVDTALYFKVGDDKVTYWVLVYVDDLLAASSSATMLKKLKELLKAAFELREISPVQKYLGLEIVRDRSVRKLWLHQQGYADKLRRRFLDEEQNGRTPKTLVSVDAYATLTFDDEEAQSLKLVGYVDADDAGDKQNRTSTGGYVFVFGGAAVSWSSQCIKCAMLSSTESEYVAATEAAKEGRRLRFLLAEFQQLGAGTPTVLRVDNKSAITVAEGMGLTCNLKHMERRQAWLQHMVKCEKFSLRYIPTVEQPADFLMKALHYSAFNRCSVAIGQHVSASEQARMKLRAWSQMASVQDYTTSFMGLADQVDYMSEAERLDKYISSLKYEIQYEVCRSRPTSFLEAVRLAESTDALMQYARAASREGIRFHGQTHRATINAVHTPDRPPKGPCYRCGKTGHFMRDCHEKTPLTGNDRKEQGNGKSQ
ncbi:unnamed protein product [Closterium sp. NIES-54]